MVTVAHEQKIICSKIHLDGTRCDKTSICRQSFAGHVVGSQAKENDQKHESNDNNSNYCNENLPSVDGLLVRVLL